MCVNILEVLRYPNARDHTISYLEIKMKFWNDVAYSQLENEHSQKKNFNNDRYLQRYCKTHFDVPISLTIHTTSKPKYENMQGSLKLQKLLVFMFIKECVQAISEAILHVTGSHQQEIAGSNGNRAKTLLRKSKFVITTIHASCAYAQQHVPMNIGEVTNCYHSIEKRFS